MSWKHVLNMTSTMDVGYALIVCIKTWYRFFASGNGNVYFILNRRTYETGITVDELY